MPRSDTGAWVTDDVEVVFEQPRGGSTQLVAPGGTIYPHAQARAQELGSTIPDDAADAPQEPVEETADAPAVETAALPAKAKRIRKG